MNGDELSQLVSRRFDVLTQLMRLGRQQLDASREGRMSEVMTLLAAKQTPLQQLGEISASLKSAIDDDPDRRQWTQANARQVCREQHEQCETMLKELLEMEADSEAALSASRDQLASQINERQGSRRATEAYSSASPRRSGGSLDLGGL